MKGQISAIECIISIIILFAAFGIFFSEFSFKSSWKEAQLTIFGRDILSAVDRNGKLVEYSFNKTYFEDFATKLFPEHDIILWTTVDDTIKNNLIISCNCSDYQRSTLQYWLKDLKLNNRTINTTICYTNLEEINPCVGKQSSDVLIIWGYKNLSNEKYFRVLERFINEGNGIVEIADLSSDSIDNIQKKIFGLTSLSQETGAYTTDDLNKPNNASTITYQAYKYFYHIPFPIKANETVGEIPYEGVSPCASTETKKGIFTFRDKTINFWICNKTAVYFDVNNSGKADFIATIRTQFNLTNYNFYLNYIENSSVLLSFKEIYNFTDFRGNNKVYPIDYNNEKIFLSNGNYTNTEMPIPVVILNGSVGKAVWIADFSRNGLENVKDDQKHLLNTLILYVSNKKSKELTFGSTKIGSTSSYINTMNYDMFEIYKIELGVGYPF